MQGRQLIRILHGHLWIELFTTWSVHNLYIHARKIVVIDEGNGIHG